MSLNWSDKRLWIAAAVLLFTPLASLVVKTISVIAHIIGFIIGVFANIVGFLIGLVNPFGLFVAICIAAFFGLRAYVGNDDELES